jgi:hypothetical protein
MREMNADHPSSSTSRRPGSPGYPRDVRSLYHKHFSDRRKERQLFATGSFFVTFAIVRAITHAIRAERGPSGTSRRAGTTFTT